jgi:hypothetical protein
MLYVLEVIRISANTSLQNTNQNAAKKAKLTVMPEGMTTATSDFRADQLQALLPSIWGLLNSLPSDEQIELLEAFLAYYNRLGANSQSKHVALGFLTRVYMVCAYFIATHRSFDTYIHCYRFNLSHNITAISLFVTMQYLPKRCGFGY